MLISAVFQLIVDHFDFCITVDTFCDVDHYQYKRHCYKPYSTKVTWYDAQKACRDAEATLVSISNGQEQAFLNSKY